MHAIFPWYSPLRSGFCKYQMQVSSEYHSCFLNPARSLIEWSEVHFNSPNPCCMTNGYFRRRTNTALKFGSHILCVTHFIQILILRFVFTMAHQCWRIAGFHHTHDDVINGNIFRVTGHLCGEFRSPVNSPHKGQWRAALMFSLICARLNGWVNNGEAGDLRHHRAHYDVTVMSVNNADSISMSWRSHAMQSLMFSNVANVLSYFIIMTFPHTVLLWTATQSQPDGIRTVNGHGLQLAYIFCEWLD